MVANVIHYLFALIALLGRLTFSLSPQSRDSIAGDASIEDWFPRDPISILADKGGGRNLVGYFPFDGDNLVNYVLPNVQEG
jgi:hypothetical protein